MNILFIVDKCNIFEIDSGGALRNTLFAKALSEMGHVDVVSFSRNVLHSNIDNCDVLFSKEITNTYGAITSLRSLIGITLCPTNPYSYRQINKRKAVVVDNFVAKKDYDLIACRYVDSAIVCGLLKYKERLVIDVDELPTNILKYRVAQATSKIEKWKKLYESKRVGRMVENLLDDILCSFCASPSEKPSRQTVFLHNTTVIPQAAPDITTTTLPRILYVGTLGYFPSRHGITHFVDSIFPHIKKAIPQAELKVVGKGDPSFLAYLNGKDGVEAVGRVEDITSAYQEAMAVVVPIYYGSGTSVKFIEAQLMNRPIVATPIGARGFGEICQDGVHYMLANNDEEFANKTIELLSSVAKSQEMARCGYEIAKENFSQEKFIEIVKNTIFEKLRIPNN